MIRKGYRLIESLKYKYLDSQKIKSCEDEYGFRLKELERNNIFKDKYLGKRCFILGSGPSIKDMDLSLLENEYTFTVNQLPKNPQFKSIHTNFHFWADARFFKIDKNNEGDMALLQTMKSVNTEDNQPYVFYSIAAYDLVKTYNLDDELNIYYFAQANINKEKYLKNNLLDMTKIMANYPTVIHQCISCAIYMGFKEIYLLGVDCTGFITIAETKMNQNEKILYGFDMSEVEKKRLQESNNKYPIEDELAFYSAIFKDYKKLDAYAIKHGVKLYNATPGGLLESIERVDYLEVLGRK